MIKYLGSKRLLLDALVGVVGSLGDVRSVVDLFSGTARVGHALKGAGYRVVSNDHNAYAATLARCYVEADREAVERDATRLIAELNALPGEPGWFTHTYCEKSRFFMPHNGGRIEAIRNRIAGLGLEPALESVLLVSLMEAADRVDSTTGVQMAYLKQWAPRAHNALELRMPAVLPAGRHGRCEAHQLDALAAIGALHGDVMYLDPPYNQHKYLGNYHVWETLVLWDQPEVYGTACKRIDCRTRTSVFNSRPQAHAALAHLIEQADCRHLVVSFSDEGYIGREQIEAMLAKRGAVAVVEHEYRRYVGAQIGIHNPAGQKVGKVSHLKNHELIYVCSDHAPALAHARSGAPMTATQTRLFE